MEKQKTRKYPDYFVNEDRFSIEWYLNSDTYDQDYKKAMAYQKRHGGELYTIIDHPDGWAFEKGYHYVNRMGYAIVKWRK